MKVKRWSGFGIVPAFLLGCVTINVYFPAAAAQEAADRIIQDVYGEAGTPAGKNKDPVGSGGAPQSRHDPVLEPMLISVLNVLITPAHAEADINIQTPAIQRLQASLKQRHAQLANYYTNGAIGMTRDGLIQVRDLNAVGLADRRKVQQIVGEDNADRKALYEEIARANGHPEWKDDIKATFAKAWIENAPAGWWYQNAQGQWVKK
jgi:uncharacterized protein YdbL (DUF1318 family)